MSPARAATVMPAELGLPLGMLSSYLFFLLRRPVSSSNQHYLAKRIAGLQSLCPLLECSPVPGLQEVVDRVRGMQPVNFLRTARAIQFQLALLHQPPQVPSHYIVSRAQPGNPLADARSVLLALGPAIGIGDEIILFPLPAWLRELRPDLEIVVLSGYRNLWDKVTAVDRREYYSSHRQLVEALRGETLGRFDIVVLADFEKPGFVPLVCAEPSIPKYIELSLGGQCAGFADNAGQRIHAMSVPSETRLNYYECLEVLLDWLGVVPRTAARYSGVVQQTISEPLRVSKIFVSPFTSKYDPSVLYWSKLLSSLEVPGAGTLEFVLDSGASLTTERFASSLLRSASARASARVSFRLASDPGSRTLALSGVLRELEQSDAVICADSFAAHAGPLFGCTTLVVARAGLENWRVPFERSFYFDMEQPPEQVISGMQSVLDRTGLEHPTALSGVSAHAAALDEVTSELVAAAANGGRIEELYPRFTHLYDDVIDQLDSWPEAMRGLLQDVPYRRTWRTFHSNGDREGCAHLVSELGRWQNTNLRKFLHLASRNGGT